MLKEKNTNTNQNKIIVKPSCGIKYIIPQEINDSGIINFSLRTEKPNNRGKISFKLNDEEIFTKELKYTNPANIIDIQVKIPEIPENKYNFLEVNFYE
jgi:hypothetical protein